MPKGPKPRRVSIVRYVDRVTGERVKKGTKGAKKVRTKSDTYYVSLVVDGKKKRVSLDTSVEAQAWINLNRLLKRRADEAAGIVDAYTDQSARPIKEHVGEWIESLRSKGTSSRQRGTVKHRVGRLCELAGWKRLTDITSGSCLAALSKTQSEDGASAQTRNHYLRSAQQFSRWAWESKRIRDHPLIGLKPISTDTDRRHDRRCPTDAEIAALLSSADAQPVRMGMTGTQRVMGYKVAMCTGFRAGELRSLTRESFDLDAGIATVRAAYDKRRRKVEQHLPAWLVEELKTYFAAGGGTWENFPANFPGRLLKADLDRAGVHWVTQGPDSPLYFDFHALRHWYITWAASQPNISIKTLMTLARHSTPTLTLKVYAKSRGQDLKDAVANLPNPTPRAGS